MTASTLRGVGHRNHFALLRFVRDLEAADQGGGAPVDVRELRRAVWAFLQAYGIRDATGAVLDKQPPTGMKG